MQSVGNMPPLPLNIYPSRSSNNVEKPQIWAVLLSQSGAKMSKIKTMTNSQSVRMVVRIY